jgi:hypothetical protein
LARQIRSRYKVTNPSRESLDIQYAKSHSGCWRAQWFDRCVVYQINDLLQKQIFISGLPVRLTFAIGASRSDFPNMWAHSSARCTRRGSGTSQIDLRFRNVARLVGCVLATPDGLNGGFNQIKDQSRSICRNGAIGVRTPAKSPGHPSARFASDVDVVNNWGLILETDADF